MPGWFSLLIKDIPSQNPAFDALCHQILGYVASSRGVACASEGHAAALEDSSYGPYSFNDPAPVNPSTEHAVIAKVAAGCIFHADRPDPTAAATAAAAGTNGETAGRGNGGEATAETTAAPARADPHPQGNGM